MLGDSILVIEKLYKGMFPINPPLMSEEIKDGFSNTNKYKIDSFYRHCKNHDFLKNHNNCFHY